MNRPCRRSSENTFSFFAVFKPLSETSTIESQNLRRNYPICAIPLQTWGHFIKSSLKTIYFAGKKKVSPLLGTFDPNDTINSLNSLFHCKYNFKSKYENNILRCSISLQINSCDEKFSNDTRYKTCKTSYMSFSSNDSSQKCGNSNSLHAWGDAPKRHHQFDQAESTKITWYGYNSYHSLKTLHRRLQVIVRKRQKRYSNGMDFEFRIYRRSCVCPGTIAII